MARRPLSAMIEIIQDIPMFSRLTKHELREVASLCFEETYVTDQVILKQLDDAQHMVAIVTGRARVIRDGSTIAKVGAGDVVGEMSLIDGLRRSADVVAETPVEAIVLHRTQFGKLVEGNASIAVKLLLAQTARLREADRKLAALG